MPQVLRPPRSTSFGHLISTFSGSLTKPATVSATATAEARIQAGASTVVTAGRRTMEV
jgi:hypothetical protein